MVNFNSSISIARNHYLNVSGGAPVKAGLHRALNIIFRKWGTIGMCCMYKLIFLNIPEIHQFYSMFDIFQHYSAVVTSVKALIISFFAKN